MEKMNRHQKESLWIFPVGVISWEEDSQLQNKTGLSEATDMCGSPSSYYSRRTELLSFLQAEIKKAWTNM